MKFAFSSNAFRRHTLTEAINAVADAGYAGIEIMCDRPHAYPPDLTPQDIAAIHLALEENHLFVANLNAFMLCAVEDYHHPSWIEVDPAYREKRVTHTMDCIDLVRPLGGQTVSTEPGGPLDGMSRDEAMGVFMPGLTRAAERAASAGVTLLVEPEPGLLIQTSNEFLDFMDAYTKRFGDAGIGLNLDVGHLYCMGEDPADAIVALRDYICHVHLEDIPESREHRHVQLGEGGVDIPGVLNALNRIGYDGFVTVELYPYLENAPATAQKAMDYLMKVAR